MSRQPTFDEIDRNGDGVVTREEYEAAMAKKRPISRGPSGEGDGTQKNPISYALFVNMFLPVLLERYNEPLKSAGETALYEKVTPVLYWKPPNVHGEDMEVNKMQVNTEVAGKRHTVVETKAKFDYGKDVLVCNLMTDSKELQKMDVETLHRNYHVEKQVKIEPHLLCNEGDPAGWEKILSQMLEACPNRDKLLEGVVWYDFRATLVEVLEEMLPRWLPEVQQNSL